MNVNELLVKSLEGSFGMLKSTLEDFSDSDLVARPLPNANHPNWQLGHLIQSEVSLLSAVGAKMPELPGDFAAVYNEESAKREDTSKFWKKERLLGLFGEVRAASVGFAKGLSADQLGSAVPGEMGQWFPTVAQLVAMIPNHTAMHIGQMQVARRKLGKKVLF